MASVAWGEASYRMSGQVASQLSLPSGGWVLYVGPYW
jgi:hypothetical protein